LSDPDAYAASLSRVRTSKKRTRVENEMIRFAIVMFLLLLLGIAGEELAGRSAEQPEASTDLVQAAQ
jgi:hypothetical protein